MTPPIHLKEVFAKYIDTIDHPIVALETGCSYAFVDECMFNLSTLNIIEHLVKPTNGILYSLDIDAKKIDICKHNLELRGLDKYVQFLQGDSVDRINGLPTDLKVNFVWHDSAEDSDHALAEFNAIQKNLTKKHVICVDDFGTTSVKWQAITDKLFLKGYLIDKFETQTGLIVGLQN